MEEEEVKKDSHRQGEKEKFHHLTDKEAETRFQADFFTQQNTPFPMRS